MRPEKISLNSPQWFGNLQDPRTSSPESDLRTSPQACQTVFTTECLQTTQSRFPSNLVKLLMNIRMPSVVNCRVDGMATRGKRRVASADSSDSKQTGMEKRECSLLRPTEDEDENETAMHSARKSAMSFRHCDELVNRFVSLPMHETFTGTCPLDLCSGIPVMEVAGGGTAKLTETTQHPHEKKNPADGGTKEGEERKKRLKESEPRTSDIHTVELWALRGFADDMQFVVFLLGQSDDDDDDDNTGFGKSPPPPQEQPPNTVLHKFPVLKDSKHRAKYVSLQRRAFPTLQRADARIKQMSPKCTADGGVSVNCRGLRTKDKRLACRFVVRRSKSR
ncbi:hypothetical protein F2P81_019463 [Scophthalmus maximus]|uniref:Uncharacterized protein n=1 Tax=Scophthalmus maximus TaxID=52904 RepID=A0A6A4RZN5_SCOMX|nr:hypothetical protein F2P81_019463 [Scophthalmus maximus]